MAVDASRHKVSPSVGGCGQPPLCARRDGGTTWAFAAILETREDIDATLDDQGPPHSPPDLPHYCASDLKVAKSHKESMRSEHSYLWGDSTGREFFGLLDVGTVEPI